MGDLAQFEAARQAVLVALNWRSTAEARQAATAYLDSVKAGNIHALAMVAYSLVGQDCPTEVRLYGFKMLQHLIRLRWDELSLEEHRHMAMMALNMIQEIAKPYEQWALKSQAATLVAEVARRGGQPVWKGMLPSLFSLSASSPVHAELVAMVLRWLPEDVTVHNEDLEGIVREGERRRQLLFGLTQTLPETLPFLFQLLETHYTAAVTFSISKQDEPAKQHAATVTATLNAIVAYAEWVPVPSMVEHRLVEACAILQSAPQFRLSACEVLKLLAYRRKPSDETASTFSSAMLHVSEALYCASEVFLVRAVQSAHMTETLGNTLYMEESDTEYGECLCEAMVGLGSQNLQCLLNDESRLEAYLGKMLGFFQLKSFSLQFQALPLWLALLRDTACSLTHKGGPGQGTGTENREANVENGKKGVAALITEELCAVLLDIAYQRLLVRQPETPGSEDLVGSADYNQNRSRLLELVRLITAIKPLVAVTRSAQKLEVAFKVQNTMQPSLQDILTLQTAQLMLETVINGIPEAIMKAEASCRGELGLKLEDIFSTLYNIDWKVPSLVEILGGYLDAMGPFLKHSQAAVPLVIEKLFALLVSVPLARVDQAADFLAANILKETSRSRLQVCTSFLRIAKVADVALLPYAQTIASTIEDLQRQGLLPRGEVNLLGEGLLIVGSAGGQLQQKQVLDWLLGPFRLRWEQPEWQERFLNSPRGIVDLLNCKKVFVGDTASDGKSSNDEVWFIYHTVTFFERALRRCAEPKKFKTPTITGDAVVEHVDSSALGASTSPMATHLKWMLPPLLKLLRCIHALWSEAIIPTLPPEFQGALAMGVPEQLSLLGTVGTQASTTNSSGLDNTHMDSDSPGADTKENDVRAWLKGIRNSGYNLLGLAASRVRDEFFEETDGRPAACAAALVENINCMEMHHVRQLIHSVIVFFVRHCPRPHWCSWLGRLLPPVLRHTQSVLSSAWTSLIREGAVKVPVNFLINSVVGADDCSSREIKTEVILDKILRDLTRETCHVLAIMATLSPRQQISSEHHPGTESNLVIGSDTIMGFLMQQGEAARASVVLGIEALEWPDSETVHKAVIFCSAVVSMAVVLTDVELQEVVGQNMFLAAIRGLTLESNASGQAELIGLLREIYIRLCNLCSGPRQVLLSLPSVTPEVLAAFNKGLGKTTSVKEQRQLLKNLLLTAGGDQLKALRAQRSTTQITNISKLSVEGHRVVNQSALEDSGLAL